MIELKEDALIVRFPDVHQHAVLRIGFQRTLRIPDDGNPYPLPPGFGRFPLRHVDDFAPAVPERWLTRGGVMLPMYQSEAMWINFSTPREYPFAVKVATGKVNAVTGERWDNDLDRDPQDYVVVPTQPWLDGYAVEKGVIRQFVAMPLGSGYTAEEQLTRAAEHGGVQLVVHPMKREAYEEWRARQPVAEEALHATVADAAPDMGLAPGGRMRQEVYDDPHGFHVWDRSHRSRCFVHLTNALVWRAITGEAPPTVPFTAKEYTRAGLPWFEYYAGDRTALEGSDTLRGMKSVEEMGQEKGAAPLPENESVTPERVIELREGLGKNQVREGRF